MSFHELKFLILFWSNKLVSIKVHKDIEDWYQQEAHIFLAPSRILRCAAWLWGGEQLREEHPQLLEGIKEAWIQWTISQAPSAILPTSCWGHLSCGFPPSWPTCTPNTPRVPPPQSTHPMASSPWMPPRVVRESLCKCLLSRCRKSAWRCGNGRKHTNVCTQQHLRESK